MLQQTQVVTVIDYYQRWLKLFPDVKTLALAEEKAVLAAWAGLGYYSRARNLHVTAKKIMSDYQGIFPHKKSDLLELKGIGAYTAGAIASLAFNQPEPILDGNLVRVFSRYYGIAFLPDSQAHRKVYWEYTRKWVESNTPALVNEGLMELGALICIPGKPKCTGCPLAKVCHARKTNTQFQFPPPKNRTKPIAINLMVVIAIHAGLKTKTRTKVFLSRASKPNFLAGIDSFPLFEARSLTVLKRKWLNEFSDLQKINLRNLDVTVTHTITHHKLSIQLVKGSILGKAASSSGQWIQWEKIEANLVSALSKKVWRKFLQTTELQRAKY